MEDERLERAIPSVPVEESLVPPSRRKIRVHRSLLSDIVVVVLLWCCCGSSI